MSRAAFSAPDFDPTNYLTELTSRPRFQTLDDLHTELKQLSTTINDELVDLVNENYEEFLGLGEQLRGGEEKVEEVRVGLMGVQREVEGVKRWVESRAEQIKELMEELRGVRKSMALGRGLLEVDERLGELEERLKIRHVPNGESGAREKSRRASSTHHDEDIGSSDDDDDDDDDEDEENGQHQSHASDESEDEDTHDDGRVPPRLKRRVDEYRIIKVLASKLGVDHPFLVQQQERMAKVRSALLSELEEVLRGAETDDLRKDVVSVRISLDEVS